MSVKKKVIAISGTPGTGKSTLAKLFKRKLGLSRLNLEDFYKQISIRYDQNKQCYDLDLKKFEKLVGERLKEAEKGLIIDSHISHLLPKKMVDLCIVLTSPDLKKLEKRLKKRGYSRKKIRENLDAEIFQVCSNQAKEKGHRVIVVDTKKWMAKRNLLKKIKKLI